MTALFLVDSGIWIDHLRERDAILHEALIAQRILGHSFVTGEVAMGSLNDRAMTLWTLGHLPQARKARDAEVFELVERNSLFSLGLGWVDAHLLASALLTPEARLWTRDRRLREAAGRLGVAGEPGR